MTIPTESAFNDSGYREYELQTFECPKCGTIDTRAVYTPGATDDLM